MVTTSYTQSAGMFGPTGTDNVAEFADLAVAAAASTAADLAETAQDVIDAGAAALAAGAAVIGNGVRNTANATLGAALGLGRVFWMDGLSYVNETGGTACSDLSVSNVAPYGDVTPKHFGAVGDGTADDTVPLRSALLSHSFVDIKNLKLRITAEITAIHPFGISSAMGGELIFDSPVDTNGFVVSVGVGIPTNAVSYIQGVTVRKINTNGGTFLTTPSGSTARAALPKYHISECLFYGVRANGLQVLVNAWDNVLILGDGDHHTVENCEAYGDYDATLEPTASNINSTFLKLGGATGVGVGLGYPIVRNTRVLNFGRAVGFVGSLVARTKFEAMTVHNSYEGVISDVAGGVAPNEISFFDCDVNTQHRSIHFDIIAQLELVGTDTTRSSAMFDHANGWTGVSVAGGRSVKITGGRAYEPNKAASSYTSVQRGYDLANLDFVQMSGIHIGTSARGVIGTGVLLVDNGSVSITGAHIYGDITNAISVQDTVAQSGLVTVSGVSTDIGTGTRLVANATSASRIVDDFLQQVLKADISATAISVTGSESVTPRTGSFLRRNVTAAVTHTINLADTDVKNGLITFRFILTNASASVVFKDALGNTQLTLTGIQTRAVQFHYLGTSPSLARLVYSVAST